MRKCKRLEEAPRVNLPPLVIRETLEEQPLNRVLFIADPIETLNPKGDTSLFFAEALTRRGDEIRWATEKDIGFALNRVVVSDGAHGSINLRDFSLVLIRKDPPFDSSYIRLCWLCALEEPFTTFINKPSLLLRYHEKLLPLEGLAQGFFREEDLIPTFINASHAAAQYFEKNGTKEIISKPFLGYAGKDILKLPSEEPRNERDTLLQPFQEKITEMGDRRVIFVDGQMVGEFTRLPPPNQFVANIARGGRAAKTPIGGNERKLIERTGLFLRHIGIEFAGADYIDGRLSEINITSPTGLRVLEALGENLADLILDAFPRALDQSQQLPLSF